MSAQAPRAELVPIDSIKAYPGNPRRGDIEGLRLSLRKFGQPRPLIVQVSTSYIVAGNQVWHAARLEGWTEVAIVWYDCDDLTARQYLIADNQWSERGTNEAAALDAFLRGLYDESGLDAALGFTTRELDRLLSQFRRADGPEPDEAPPVPAEPWVRPGQLFTLGRHRLLCGDATKPEHVARLLDGAKLAAILTDPPYGINLDTDYRSMGTSPASRRFLKGGASKEYRPVVGDDRLFDPRPVLAALGQSPREQFWFGADYYRRALSTDDRDGSWLVWDKRNETSDAGFGSGFELIWSRARHKRDLLRFYMFGAFGSEAAHRLHPTQKPTRLLGEILTRWTKPGDAVYDGFVGSGSTLIAAEQTERRCYALDIDPGYVQVTIERWQTLVGAKATLVDAA